MVNIEVTLFYDTSRYSLGVFIYLVINQYMAGIPAEIRKAEVCAFLSYAAGGSNYHYH